MKLKPCPFCGESEDLKISLVGGYWQIDCNGCSASVSLRTTQQLIVQAWNRRVEEKQP
jgi:Lar family restriction alleviation protein